MTRRYIHVPLQLQNKISAITSTRPNDYSNSNHVPSKKGSSLLCFPKLPIISSNLPSPFQYYSSQLCQPAFTCSFSTQTFYLRSQDTSTNSVSSLFNVVNEEIKQAASEPTSPSSLPSTIPAKRKGRKKLAYNEITKEWTFSTGNFRISPRKLMLLAKQVKGLKLSEALLQMQFSKKAAAKRVISLLNRAAANVKHNYNGTCDNLYIRAAIIGKGVYLKRMLPHGKGMAGKMHHPFTHMRIYLKNHDGEFRKDGKPKLSEFQLLCKAMRKHKLFKPMSDTIPLRSIRVPWSTKGYKYITKNKWMYPAGFNRVKNG